jgi:crotonobetainyl-CoA:carnitine CoA-transferase CaiB-like acyl-CoA transferase
MLDTSVAMLGYLPSAWLGAGVNMHREGNHHHNICPYGSFTAKDGDIVITCGSDNQWNKFREGLGLPDLPQWSRNDGRVEDKKAVIAAVNEKL